jgi:hypothetical protein
MKAEPGQFLNGPGLRSPKVNHIQQKSMKFHQFIAVVANNFDVSVKSRKRDLLGKCLVFRILCVVT